MSLGGWNQSKTLTRELAKTPAVCWAERGSLLAHAVISPTGQFSVSLQASMALRLSHICSQYSTQLA